MMIIDKQKILESIPFEPISFIDIARRNKLDRNQNSDLKNVLYDLMRANKINRTRDSQYYKFNVVQNYEGPIKKHKDGFGFLDFKDGASAFVPAFRLDGIMHRDVVDAQIVKDPFYPDKYLGLINKIVRRANEFIVGTLVKEGRDFVLHPLDKNVTVRIVVREVDEKRVNERVKVQIFEYQKDVVFAKYLDSYGSVDDPRSIIDGLVNNENIPIVFSNKCLEEASRLPDEVTELPAQTTDHRELFTVTIDGETTKDFDDAISVERLGDGQYKLYVHIADVAHYVPENTALDTEALDRGNSVYLVDRTIPMLPKKLSDGICSLNPHVDRLTLTAEMVIDQAGNTTKFRLYRSVINSNHRLTYNQVNDFFANKLTFDDELGKMLVVAQKLSKILGDKKAREGYVDLEIEEAKVLLDDAGKPVEIKVIVRGFSEIMIENFMVRANEAVAEYMTKHELPCMYRVHDVPTPEKFEAFKSILKTLNVNLTFNFTKNPAAFAAKVRDLKRLRFDNFMKVTLLRTMEKAVYSPNNIGHFGLASKSYSHFTSPIRRYSDLILHRMIHTFVFEKNYKRKSYFANILTVVGNKISQTERIAMDLERKVSGVKKAEFMERFLNKEMRGQIVSIKKFGIFVEFENTVSGLLRFLDLPNERFEVIKEEEEVKSATKNYKIGDFVDTIIKSIDLEMGRVSLALKN